MTVVRLAALTSLAMLAFAGNSLLCRLALKHALIDAASFTAIRLFSGALVLLLFASLRVHERAVTVCVQPRGGLGGNWRSAIILFVYAATFSFAYTSLPTGAGALLLFGAVQLTMIMAAWRLGERLDFWQAAGLGLALSGLAAMLMPGLSAPPLAGALLMMVAGIAWGMYSLLGRDVTSPVAATAGNFLRAAPLSLALSLVLAAQIRLDTSGVLYAVLSGALTSGIGYVVWYAALRGLSATRAASVQLTVPVLAAFGGTFFLGERFTLRLLVSCVAVIGGIALVVFGARRVGN